MTQRDLGWLEGLIDGEGGFCIWTSRNAKTFNIEVAIYNTCFPLLKRVKRIVGDGSIRKHAKQDKKHKTCYTYKFTYSTLKKLLPKLKLIVKERQRKIVIKALKWSKERHTWGRWYPNTNRKYLTKAMKQIRKYNHE